jgi:membrane fusion protein (multidrug efflux system)
VRGVVDTDKNALLVPQQAVAELQGRHLIALVGADNKVSIRPVAVGEWFGRQWVINGNINAGDRVVAEGIQKVHDGAVVHPVRYVEKIAAAAPDSAPPTGMAAEKKPSPEAR